MEFEQAILTVISAQLGGQAVSVYLYVFSAGISLLPVPIIKVGIWVSRSR